MTMITDCLPLSALPGTTPLYRDFAESGALRGDTSDARDATLLRRCYPGDPFALGWSKQVHTLDPRHRQRLADELLRQAELQGAGEPTRASIDKLRGGAAAVVTGQQVGLFGGPLLTLLKAATAIRKAQDAARASGRAHVPVFWLATEDHDLAEVDTVALPSKADIQHLSLGLHPSRPVPVGALRTGGAGREALAALLEKASELMGWGPYAELLSACYGAEGATLASAFARLLATVFAEQGLIVVDAANRELHALGAPVLRAAIERADELERDLLERSRALQAAGYHAQVLVTPGQSLLFLLADDGARVPLRRIAADSGTEWRAGGKSYAPSDLLAMLEAAPDRLSPNALLRPVMQDAIFPTAAYIGGPAEIAYFTQSAVLYEAILGQVTPVLPRLSATLIDSAIAKILDQQELGFERILEAKTVDDLALRLGARAMPIVAKRRLAAAGNALDEELTGLVEYMSSMSADLGRTAGVSASKMRYQMNRLRRMAARFEIEKTASLGKQALAVMLELLPEGHLQERTLGAIWALAKFGETLPAILVENASQECPGHRVIRL